MSVERRWAWRGNIHRRAFEFRDWYPNVFGGGVLMVAKVIIKSSALWANDSQGASGYEGGGLTWTIALLPDSPAIGTGKLAGAPLKDQRGAERGDYVRRCSEFGSSR